jgi:heme exporter protein A
MRLIAENLSSRRGGRVLFAGLSFAVERGEALLVTGPNGAGKTTLLRTLAGFLSPESGSVRLEGAGQDISIAEQCHYVGHANAAKPSLTVAENATFWMGFLGGHEGGLRPGDAGAEASPRPLWARSGIAPPLTPPHKGEGNPVASASREEDLSEERRLDAALGTFDLAALRDIPVGYLSAGQRRRVALLRLALAGRPVWLLDEPTASLDDASQALLAAAVNRHLGEGGIVVAATHLPLGFERARELRLGQPAAAAA